MAGPQGQTSDGFLFLLLQVLKLVWAPSSLAIFILIYTALYVPNERIYAIAEQEHHLLTLEAMPTSLVGGWGLYAANPMPPPPAPDEKVVLNLQDKSLAGRVDLTTSMLEKFTPAKRKFRVYWVLMWPRIKVLLGILPGLAAMCCMTWGFGQHHNAIRMNSGQPLSSDAYLWCKVAFALSVGLFCDYVVLPMPLPSSCLILAAAATIGTMGLLRYHRA